MAIPSAELDSVFLRGIALLRSSHPCAAQLIKALQDEVKDRDSGCETVAADAAERRAQILLSHHTTCAQPSTTTETTEDRADKSDRQGNVDDVTSVIGISDVKSEFSLVETIEEVALPLSSSDNIVNIKDIPDTIHIDDFEKTVADLSSGGFDSGSVSQSKDGVETTEIVTSSQFSITDASGDIEGMVSLEDVMEMDFSGPSCEVCSNCIDDNGDNRLVQCHDCHLHFHQNCHTPPITNKDVNDPRLVWYCIKCIQQTEKEMAAQQQNTFTNVNKSLKNRTGDRQSQMTNPFQQNIRQNLGPFRRASAGNIEGVDQTETIPLGKRGQSAKSKLSDVLKRRSKYNLSSNKKKFESRGLEEALSLPKIKDERETKHKTMEVKPSRNNVNTTAPLAVTAENRRQRSAAGLKMYSNNQNPPGLRRSSSDDQAADNPALVAVKQAQVHPGIRRRQSSFDAATLDMDRAKTSFNTYKSLQKRVSVETPPAVANGVRTDHGRNSSSMSTSKVPLNNHYGVCLSLAEHVKIENAKYNEKLTKRYLFDRWIVTNKVNGYQTPVGPDELENAKSRLSNHREKR